jgi:hypothetical protein
MKKSNGRDKMLNRDIYLVNPADRKLVNEGVASVNDRNLNVLRYEIETFVCDGQYEKGIEHILDVYLRNLRQEQQPAVWVSGFFGSGKSHLVKMLSTFWKDVEFPDGARARGLANLPDSIKAQLHELSTQAKRYGGLHSAAGTLGSGASGSVRLALLSIIFKSVGLPENYANASFVMWLKSENILDEVMHQVVSKGYDWDEELDNLYVAEGLHETLSEIKPNIFPTHSSCVETLNNRFPNKTDITSDEMIKAIKEALSKDGNLPLTLIVIDEVEQYIGDSTQRAMDVQEVVEACSKQIGSKLLFIATGQTAVTGTALLKKLEGRFTVRIELSDADVDAVVRKVILAKKPDTIEEIKKIMDKNIGEISRHLSSTSIGHNQKDTEFFVQDYPILPVRRRFWGCTLRVLDQTGTDSQLRNQLSMVHKAAQSNINAELGNVIPADYLYFNLADKMLHARVLPRKVYEKTMLWITQDEDNKLIARACGLIFLINKLSSNNNEIGIKATIDTLADLMVTNLSTGSSFLRSKLPILLEKCEILMKVKDEYRIQTEENLAWLDEYGVQKNNLQNELHRVISDREDRIKKKFGEIAGKISVTQGQSKVSRDVYTCFEAVLPSDSNENIYIWIRNEWNIDEETVRIDAKQAGNESPTIFVFIPKRSDIAHHLIELKAALVTISKKGSPPPITPEGKEAMAAMETIRQNAERSIDALLSEALSEAKVFQAGGNEIIEGSLKNSIIFGVNNSLLRLYKEFDIADNSNWGKVYSKAKEGSPDALKLVDFNGEITDNPLCKALMKFIAGGKKGSEIRKNFEGSTYGWPGDAVDAALQTLLVSGQIRCIDDSGKNVDPKALERKQIGKATFKLEAVTVSVFQRLQIRKLFQKLGIKTEQGNESGKASEFINTIIDLAEKAGGQEPKPIKPDISFINELKSKSGNDQLIAIFENKEQLTEYIDNWNAIKEKIENRIDQWEALENLIDAAGEEIEVNDVREQSNIIKKERLLLHEPDMIIPLTKSLENRLRKILNEIFNKYENTFGDLSKQLDLNSEWYVLDDDKKEEIKKDCGITKIKQLNLGSYDELINTLKLYPLKSWNDRQAALKPKFEKALELAIKEKEPKLQIVDISKRTLKSDEDIDLWIEEIREQLKRKLENGPIAIR